MERILVLAVLSIFNAAVNASEFSIQPVDSAVRTFGYKTVPGRNDRDCAMQCELQAAMQCSAVAHVPETGLCLLSALRNASFGATGGRGHVFRRPYGGLDFEPYAVGDRVFYRIQQRLSAHLSFARNWTEYELGFGDDSDFWVGLKKMNQLTGNSPRLLRVEAVSWSNMFSFCEYSDFTVGNSSTNYIMSFGSYLSGSSNMSRDSLAHHKGRQFSTFDRDNDASSISCSPERGSSGWWFGHCTEVNPNGVYQYATEENRSAMWWWGATPARYIPINSIRLMIQMS